MRQVGRFVRGKVVPSACATRVMFPSPGSVRCPSTKVIRVYFEPARRMRRLISFIRERMMEVGRKESMIAARVLSI